MVKWSQLLKVVSKAEASTWLVTEWECKKCQHQQTELYLPLEVPEAEICDLCDTWTSKLISKKEV